MNYPGSVESIKVDSGVVYLKGESLSEEEKTILRKMLSDVIGVLRVEFVTESTRDEAPGVPSKKTQRTCSAGGEFAGGFTKIPAVSALAR